MANESRFIKKDMEIDRLSIMGRFAQLKVKKSWLLEKGRHLFGGT